MGQARGSVSGIEWCSRVASGPEQGRVPRPRVLGNETHLEHLIATCADCLASGRMLEQLAERGGQKSQFLETVLASLC